MELLECFVALLKLDKCKWAVCTFVKCRLTNPALPVSNVERQYVAGHRNIQYNRYSSLVKVNIW